jgi:S1-C subfamily serine protease
MKARLLLAAACLLAATTAAAPAIGRATAHASPQATAGSAAAPASGQGPRGLLPRAEATPRESRRTPVVAAVEKVRGAVVNVSAEELVRIRVPSRQGGGDSAFSEFFERPRYRKGYAVTSLGSGVIVSPDGYVLTNNHVVERGARFRVGFADGRELTAKGVGTDPAADLAVLKLDTRERVPSVPIGRSDDLMPGETVIAIGNPFGLSHTVTTGVVSAVHRNFKAGDRTLFDFIQTDASINPGNSGGPLLDIEGRLIGINTAILGDRSAGIGFAIPVDRARRLADDLITHGEVREGYVGLAVEDLPAREGAAVGASGGVRVTGVDPGSPAEKAGVRRGDQVETVDGFAPESAAELRFRVRDLPIGATARLELTRGKERLTVAVPAVELSPLRAEQLVQRRVGVALEEERVAGGTVLAVRSVTRGTAAERVGIQKGDLVREVNGAEVGTLDEFRRAASSARRSGQLVLLVQRGYAAERIAFDLD